MGLSVPPFLQDFSERLWFDGFVAHLIAEDLQQGDLTSEAVFPPHHTSTARIISKSDGILCGMMPVRYIWERYTEVDFRPLLTDGTALRSGRTAALLNGPTIQLLAFERLCLNLLHHLSAVATQAHHLQQKAAPYGTVLLDTRKTTPGLRWLEKWATTVGGARAHRRNLADELMIKDNHIDAAGGMAPAIEKVLDYLQQRRLRKAVVLEVRSLEDIEQAAPYFPHLHRLLLDNFTPDEVRAAVQRFGKHIPMEASGGITEDNLEAYARTGVPFISTSAIHRPSKRVDLSFQIEHS